MKDKPKMGLSKKPKESNHPDVKEDKKMIKKMIKPDCIKPAKKGKK
jgi:hypothetical protein